PASRLLSAVAPASPASSPTPPCGRLHQFVSVHSHAAHKAVHVASDGGRLCRPYIIVEAGRPLVARRHLDELASGLRDWEDFLHEGLIEYLDVNEEKRLRVCAGIIPIPASQPEARRNTYQLVRHGQAGHEALWSYNQNEPIRDTVQYLLAAVSPDEALRRRQPVHRQADGAHGGHQHRTAQTWPTKVLEADGVAYVGARVSDRQVLVNKEMPIVSATMSAAVNSNVEYKSVPQDYKGMEPAYVEKVMVAKHEDNHGLVKLQLRQTRRPEIGDKFSSRHERLVCGLIVDQADMPFSRDGSRPGYHNEIRTGYPSRMTVGKLLELLGSKAAVLDGAFKDGTAFGGDGAEQLGAILREHGFNSLGKDVLTSGVTGETMEAYVYSGPIYYQKLKHMVLDKIHARARRSLRLRVELADGAVRLGEMERDCLIGYGASMLLG
uniref:DNA-directed RNA polymerase n=1 Tax=Macrostomum lignano TaxID=282301 RepID=A0A1I8FAX6_9PLAT